METEILPVKATIEQRPFQGVPVREFVSKLCRASFLQPTFLSPEAWREGGGMQTALGREIDGRQELFLPDNVRLEDFPELIRILDEQTYAGDPNKQNERRQKLQTLGKTIGNIGIYLAQNLDNIQEGRELAEATAVEFYKYGRTLESRVDSQTQPEIEEIGQRELSSDEVVEIDKLFGVDKLYKFNLSKGSADSLQDTRRTMLAHFFEQAEKAKTSESHKHGIHRVFERYGRPLIEQPKSEFYSAIFSRGLQELIPRMGKDGWDQAIVDYFSSLGVDIVGQQQTIAEALELPRLKAELDALRNSDATPEDIGDKEREIALEIQKAVSKFPREERNSYPFDVAQDQIIDCVGASMIGSKLLEQVGIKHLLGDIPLHSIILLVTADQKPYFYDFLNPQMHVELTNKDIKGMNPDGTDLTVRDILAFSDNPTVQGIFFDIPSIKFGSGQQASIGAFPAEIGLQSQLLYNLGIELENDGDYETSIEAYKQVLSVNPSYANAYSELAHAQGALGRYTDAIKNIEKALSIKKDSRFLVALAKYLAGSQPDDNVDERVLERSIGILKEVLKREPTHADAWIELGQVQFFIGKHSSPSEIDNAVNSFRQATVVAPTDPASHYLLFLALDDLGRDEATAAGNEALRVCDEKLQTNISVYERYRINRYKAQVLSLLGRSK